MTSHRAPGRNFNWRNVSVPVAAAVVLLVGAGVHVVDAATAKTSAACTAAPAVSYTAVTAKITMVCTIPLPASVPTSPGPTDTPTPSVTPTPTTTPSPTPTPTSTTPAPPSTGFPDAASTGPTGTLKPYTGNGMITGTVTGYDIPGSVTLAAGASLVNSRVRCENENTFCVSMGKGSTLSQVEVGGGADGVTYTAAIGVWTGGPGNTISKTDIHHTSDGLRLDGGTTVSDSYIHSLVIDQVAGVHSDGAQVTAGTAPIILTHDTIEGGTNDAFFDEVSASPLSIDGSYFIANNERGNQSSYAVAVYPKLSSASVTNCVFTHGWQVAPIMLTSGTSSGNVYTDGTPLS